MRLGMGWYGWWLALALLLVVVLVAVGLQVGQPFLLAASSTGESSREQASREAMEQLSPILQQIDREAASGKPGSARSYSGYTRVTDDSEAMRLDVPVEWKEIETGPWEYHGRQVGVFIAASGDLERFSSLRSEPGVFFGVSRALASAYDEQSILALEAGDVAQKCQTRHRLDYGDRFRQVSYDHYAGCAGGHAVVVGAAMNANRKLLSLVRIVITDDADVEAMARVFQTFQTLGDPEEDYHHDH